VTRVLVVDDEPQIRRALATNLRARGYEVDLAGSGEEALRLVVDHHPDVVVLDLGLPGIDGLEVVQALRTWSRVPIVVLSVREGERDKVAALDAGADDYVTKPFGMNELLARLRAAVRRATPGDDQAVVDTDDFCVDLAAKEVRRHDAGGDVVVHLTPTEWALLELLARRRGRLVSQSDLLTEVWGPGNERKSDHLRVHMASIRRKVERDPSRPRWLLTEPGMGYRFV
jgi:two-component system KDP operon response regulator KdpE